jgi:hypothetical protein
MSKVHLARSGFITKAALPSITRQRGTTTASSDLMLFGAGKTTVANNTTFIDSSTNAFTVTRNGDTVHSGHNPFSTVSDGSAYFDGTGDYLEIASNSAYNNFGTGDFTIECFINITGNSPTTDASGNKVATIFTTAVGFSGAGYNIELLGNSTTTGTGIVFASRQGSQISFQYTGTVTQNVWHHIAISRSGTTTYMFLDGTQVASTVLSNQTIDTTQPMWFGLQNITGYTHPFLGYITNFRIVKGTAVYTSNFTSPTSALTAITNTQLLLLTDNYSIVNSTPTVLPVTINGNTTISTAQYPTGMTRSIYFDGTGDYLTTPSNAAFSFGTGDFTIECYAYMSSIYNNGVFHLANSHFPASATGIAVAAFNVSGGWQVYYGSSSNITAPTAPSANTWTHLALVRASGVIKLYVNGTSVISTSDTTNYTYTYLAIGGYYSTSYLMTGYVSNFRIVKGTAVYTSNFTSPSAPLSINISVPAFVTNAIYGVNQLA